MPDAHLGRSMREVIAPYNMLIQAEGGTPDRAVADLLRTAAIFRVGSLQQKYGAVKEIADRFGLDLRVFSGQGQAQPQPQQQFHDPRLDKLLADQQREAAQRTQVEQQQLEGAVSRWMNEVDEKGEPKRPYLSDAINEVSALIPAIRQQNPDLTHTQALDLGYECAIWANPEIRALLQQKAAGDLEASRRAENQSRVRDAKRAASVNVPRRASLPATAKPGTLEETIAATARELGLISS